MGEYGQFHDPTDLDEGMESEYLCHLWEEELGKKEAILMIPYVLHYFNIGTCNIMLYIALV
jgi:hypothetical protein